MVAAGKTTSPKTGGAKLSGKPMRYCVLRHCFAAILTARPGFMLIPNYDLRARIQVWGAGWN